MKTRLEALDRLRSLYGVVTHMHGVALEQASAAVRDAEERIDVQRARSRRSSVAGLKELSAGDKEGWMVHESQRAFSARDAEWLGGVRDQRAILMQSAAQLYQENRVQFEQMQSVLKGMRATIELERGRREQRESDDRFLSRQRWLERRQAERVASRAVKHGA